MCQRVDLRLDTYSRILEHLRDLMPRRRHDGLVTSIFENDIYYLVIALFPFPTKADVTSAANPKHRAYHAWLIQLHSIE